MLLTSKFVAGDRVIVTRFESPYGCDLNGYYGHVDWVHHGADMAGVWLEGCTADAPDHDDAYGPDGLTNERKPFPFLTRELDHAD